MGDAIGYVLLAVAVLVVLAVTATPSWNAGRVRTTYDECMMVAQTPTQQAACNPAAPAPTPR